MAKKSTKETEANNRKSVLFLCFCSLASHAGYGLSQLDPNMACMHAEHFFNL